MDRSPKRFSPFTVLAGCARALAGEIPGKIRGAVKAAPRRLLSSFRLLLTITNRLLAHFFASKKSILSGTVPEFFSVWLPKGGAAIGAGMPAPTWSGTSMAAASSPPG